MKSKISSFAMTIFAVSTIFVGQSALAHFNQIQSTQIVFKGAEAKMSLNLFKFQLKNRIAGFNLSLSFVPTEKEVAFDVTGLKSKVIKKQLSKAIRDNNNCSIIKENEPDQINAAALYHECVRNSNSADTILSMNSKNYSSWMNRVLSEKKLSVVREEMALEAQNVDSDTVLMLTSLAQDVQDEVNFLYPRAIQKVSEISVVTKLITAP